MRLPPPKLLLAAFLLTAAGLIDNFVFADQSKTSLATPSKRFLTLQGFWIVTEAPAEFPELHDDIFLFDHKNRNVTFPQVLPPDLPFGSGNFRPAKGKGLAREVLGSRRKGVFNIDPNGSAQSQRYLDVLGASGDFEVFFPNGSQFQELLGTFTPDGGSVDKLGFRAKLVVHRENTNATLVYRVKTTGARQAGKSMTFKIDLLNRGPSIVPNNSTILFLGFPSEVTGVSIQKRRQILDDCEETVNSADGVTVVACTISYLGPPEKTTYASLTAKIVVPEELAGKTLDFAVSAVSEFVNLSGVPKNLSIKIKEKKSPGNPGGQPTPPSSGIAALAGDYDFFRTFNGAVFFTLRARCQLEGSVINCDLIDLLGQTVNYKVGDRVLRNLQFQPGSTSKLSGEILDVVSLTYRATEFFIHPSTGTFREGISGYVFEPVP